jgi:hypothetical protein
MPRDLEQHAPAAQPLSEAKVWTTIFDQLELNADNEFAMIASNIAGPTAWNHVTKMGLH